jgi:TonB-dependent siderophore receptor
MRSIIMSNLNATNLNKYSISRIKSCAVAVQFAINKLSNSKVPHCGIAALALSMSTGTFAQEVIDIKAQPLANAVKEFAQKTGMQIGYNAKVMVGKRSSGVKGSLSIEQALKELLRGSGLAAIKKTNDSYVLKKFSDRADNNIAGTLALTTVGSESSFGDAPQEQGGFKAEYQKTATKMAMKIIDTPQAISAVTRDALDARQVKTLAVAVELTPSISSNGIGTSGGSPDMFGGYGQTSNVFTIRGQKADIRTDGFKTSSFYRDDDGIDISAFERIEVIRGPSGFYGAGSLGGFINKVRKKPQTEFGANLSLQAGSYDTYRAAGGITGAINDDETLRGRIDFAYNNAGAFTDKIKSERSFIAPSIETIISDNTRVLIQLLYQKDEYNANIGTPVKNVSDKVELFEEFSSRTELYGSIGDKSSKEHNMASVVVDHEISDRWLASLYLQSYKQKTRFVNGNFASVYDGIVYSAQKKDHNESDNWAGELRLQGSFDAFEREHQMLFGIESNQQNSTRSWGSGYNYISNMDDYEGNIGDYPAIPADEIETQWNNNNKSRNQAFYGQVLFNVLDNTQLLMATRYDVAKTDNWASYYTTEETKDSAWTSRLGIIQTISDNINVYASYGQSFTPSGETGRNGPLEPITGEGYELGLKTIWFSDELGVNLSLYQQELDNRPITDPTNNRDEGFSISAGKHLTKGVELGINGSFYPGWTIGGAVSLMDNEFIEEGDPNKGLSFEGSIDNQASIYGSYEFQQGKLTGLSMGATFVHLGDRKYINTDITPYKQAYADGYHRLDFNLSYQGLAHWDINLLVRNMTDEKYLSGAYRIIAYWGAPRSVLLQATYNFD